MLSSNFLFTSDHHKIFYDHYKNGHKKAVILAHGFFNSRKAALLTELAHHLNNEYDVYVLDFRGHGDSSGLFYWTSKEYLDLEVVLKEAHKYYQAVGVLGFSLGAATSLIAAFKSDLIDSLIAVSAPTEFEKIEYRFWEMDIENDIFYNFMGEGIHGKGVRPGPFWLKKDKPINGVSQIKIPVYYIHGDNDWIIKPWHSEALYSKTTSPKKITIISNGYHAEYLMRKNKNAFLPLARHWFQETL